MEHKTNFFKTTAGQVVIITICYAVTLSIVLLPATLGAVIALMCVYFGWKALDRIQPVYFLWLPIIGWIIYFIVKVIISYMIGLFVAPFKIAIKNSIFRNPLIFQGLPPIKCSNLMYFPLFLPL